MAMKREVGTKTYYVKDEKGNAVCVKEPILAKARTRAPAARQSSSLTALKKKIEELIESRSITPTFGNKLYGIAKQDKRKYKKLHWHVKHSLGPIEVANAERTIDVLRVEMKLLLAVLRDKEICKDEVRAEILDEVSSAVLCVICADVFRWEDELRNANFSEDAISMFRKRFKYVIDGKIEFENGK